MKLLTKTTEDEYFRKEDWYTQLNNNGQYIFDLINKYHEYFSKKDELYRIVVRSIKILILFLAMVSTIVLGIKNVLEIDTQIITGLIISAIISFVTAIASYFNFEEYWMRNISIHIELNILRDNFIYEAKSLTLENDDINEYRIKIENMQRENIKYWENVIKRV